MEEKLYDSNNNGKFRILGEVKYFDDNKNIYQYMDYRRFVIEFVDTGYVTDASWCAIRHGRVKDNLKPCVAGIGFIGSRITVSDPSIYPFYKSWNDMINRCCNVTDGDYKYYGAQGVTVDPRWYDFTIFLHDIQCIPGFEKKLLYPDMYQLDKDYLQYGLPKNKRVYSCNTCAWISKYDNTIIMTIENNTNLYFGVVCKDNAYHTMVNGTCYGKFTTPEAAANLFNYYYPKLKGMFNDINFINDVPIIPFEELKNFCIGSTTIREIGVGLRSVQSDRASQPLSAMPVKKRDEDIVSTSI